MALTKVQRVGTGTAALALGCAIGAPMAVAQMPIGSVSTIDASVSGQTSIANDRAQLGTNGTVFAKEHGAFVQLLRGGSVRVCATSGVHLTAGNPAAATSGPEATVGTSAPKGGGAALPGVSATDTSSPPPVLSAAEATAAAAAAADVAANAGSPNPTSSPTAEVPAAAMGSSAANIPPPLMVALDRGAMELRMGVVRGDLVMAPDLRLSFTGDGQLDVRIRVGRNGDTCVENRVAGLGGHPGLSVGSLFGNETYNVLPGQHVLFEAGNLREVVDNESSPCGCPEEAVKPAPPAIGDLSLTKGNKVTGAQAAIQHPFPADVSQGLAPPPPVPQAPPQVTHTQVATTMVFNGNAPDSAVKKDDPAVTPPAKKKGFFHSIGRFFRNAFS